MVFFEAYTDEELSFNPEIWYEPLRQYTFRTEFVPLTVEEAQAVIESYRQRFLNRPVPDSEKNNSLLKTLQDKIETCLQQHFAQTNAFVRLSTRSPKDGFPRNIDSSREQFEQAMKSNVQALKKKDWNTILKLFFKICMQSLLIKSGEDAMHLLTTSERVYVDLIKAIAPSDQPSANWNMNIVLREWDPLLVEEREFRCFVSKGQLTAVAQYNHYCYYQYLTLNASSVATRLQAFFELVKPHVPFESYVLDVAIRSDESLIVIELNPFRPSTGGSLFHWNADHVVLTEGPFEFRYRTEQNPDLSEDFVSYAVDSVFGQDYFHQLTQNLLTPVTPWQRILSWMS